MIGFENYVIFIGTLKPDAPISVFLLILLEDTDALKPRDVSAIWILGNNIDKISRCTYSVWVPDFENGNKKSTVSIVL